MWLTNRINERQALQQELASAQAQVAQLNSQRADQDALQKAEQLVAYAKSKFPQSSREEQLLREKLERFKVIALHKRALRMSEQQQGREAVEERRRVDMAEIDALVQANPPLPDVELKSKLVALLLEYHHTQADDVAAQYYASVR